MKRSGFSIAAVFTVVLVAASTLEPIALIHPSLASEPTPENPARNRAEQLLQQGFEQYQAGQLEAAIESWQRARSLYQSISNPRGEGIVLKNLGAAYLILGNYRQAIAHLQAFLTLPNLPDNRFSQGQVLGNLGIAYKATGFFPQAIEAHQQALAIMRELGNRQAEGQILANLGNTYERLGNYEEAIAIYQESLTLTQALHDRQGEAIALGNLGAIYASLGESEQAIAHYEQSLAISDAIGDRQGQGYALNNLGLVYHTRGEVERAIDYYQQSLAIAKALSELPLQGEILVNLGTAREDLGEITAAIAAHQESLAIARTLGNPHLEGLALNNLGHALKTAGKLPEAEQQLREAVMLLESLRPGLPDSDAISIFDTQVLTYNLLQQILIAQNKVEAALEIAERGRARAFVELLVQRLSPTATEQAIAQAQPPTIADIKRIAREQQATLVEYSLVPERDFRVRGKQRGKASELFIWVVRPTGEVAFRQVNLKAEEIGADFDDLIHKSRIVKGPRVRQGEAARAQMYQQLVAPIAAFLPTNPEERVIFIPQDLLLLLPFPALPDASGQYLIEKHAILTAPAIQLLDLTHQQRQRLDARYPESVKGNKALIVGNPTMPTLKFEDVVEQLAPLPEAEREAEAIAHLLNAEAVTGNRATEAAIVQQLPQARLVHLATHGLLSEIQDFGIPGAIALAPSPGDDGFLTAGEIFNLRLNAELVVLSACDTGRGTITGDGVVGLSRSLIAAGVPSVVVSLWAIPDAPTSLLMTEFYRHLQHNPDKAQALRQAMLATMEQYPQPYNWGAFTLIGEAK